MKKRNILKELRDAINDLHACGAISDERYNEYIVKYFHKAQPQKHDKE